LLSDRRVLLSDRRVLLRPGPKNREIASDTVAPNKRKLREERKGNTK